MSLCLTEPLFLEKENDMAQWVKREHSKGAIDRAAEDLLPWWKGEGPEPETLGEAYGIVQNWRTSHAMPLLTFRMLLGQRARRIEEKAIVAQRMKRFLSVMNKLTREPNMKLSQMQDLGGCRAILSDVQAVQKLYQLYKERNDPSEGDLKCYDYIATPKPDGYRGIYIVGRYRARLEENEPWNGHRIEIQLRSDMQHAFATAVETVTTFTMEPLKFGAGPKEWRRFFSLVGSAFALREGTPLVASTPSDNRELVKEVRELQKSLHVRRRLKGWTNAMRQLPRKFPQKINWILLVLDVAENKLKAQGFYDRPSADSALAEIEKQHQPELDAVLVWVNSIKDLRSTYPNYYADTRAFVKALNSVLWDKAKEG